jgi:hypothetical protein
MMATIYEKVPLYKVVKTWDDNNPNLSEVYKLQSKDSRNKSQVKIHKDNGKYGIKFTIDKTIPEFNKGVGKSDLNWADSFGEFDNVLQGNHRTAWKQVLHEHFPEPVDATAPVPAMQDCSLEENFHQAIQLFIQRMLNEKKPRDRQYIYMQPGRDCLPKTNDAVPRGSSLTIRRDDSDGGSSPSRRHASAQPSITAGMVLHVFPYRRQGKVRGKRSGSF